MIAYVLYFAVPGPRQGEAEIMSRNSGQIRCGFMRHIAFGSPIDSQIA